MNDLTLTEKDLELEKPDKADKAVAAQLEELTPEEVAHLPELLEMIKAGVIYGRKKTKMNPKMKPYIYTFRSGIALFDLLKTLEGLEKAAAFLKEKMAAGGKILFVATEPSAKDLVKKLAEDLGQFYVVERWLGGMLTNYKTISSRIERFKSLKAGREANKFEKYTKKERLLIDREIEHLGELFGGVETMDKLPAAMFIINTQVHETALREAIRTKVPLVALINSDSNPELVNFPIVGNSHARASIVWVLERLRSLIK